MEEKEIVMDKFISFMEDFTVYTVMIRLCLAAICGAIIGLERSKHGRQAGMRTHILVSIGACLATLMGIYAVEQGLSTDPSRIGAQVISGIGFLGAGIILVQNKSRIIGLTTSAGLWNTATIGLAMGMGFYEGALICFVVALITALFLPKLEYWFSKNDAHTMLYIELSDSSYVNAFYNHIRACSGGGVYQNTKDTIPLSDDYYGEVHKIDVTAPRSTASGRIGIQLTLTLPQKSDVYTLEKKLLELEGVICAVEL